MGNCSRTRSAGLLIPPFRQTLPGNGWNCFAGFGIMRGVVKQSQSRAAGVAKIDNVQRSRFLVEIIAITARIESEEGAEQQPDGRFVGNGQDVFAGMLADEID